MADPTSGGDNRTGIGVRLRAGRERLGMTVLQAAEKLHVDPKVLESLESENFESLGAPVFVRGHLRRYAELVGEKPTELQEIYAASTRVEAPDLTRLPKVAPSRDPRKLVVPALVIIIGFALAGAVWWVLRGIDSSIEGAMPEPAGSPLASEQPPQQPEVPDAASRAESTSPASSALADTAAPPAPESPPAAQATPTVATSQEAAQPQPAGPLRPTELTLRFSEDSWVEVYDAKGERLFYDIGSANSVRRLTGTPPLRVVLGNAPGVTLEVNGRSQEIPAAALRDELARFTVTASGRIVASGRVVQQRADGG
jgi:cytoskeleton protein RodZ